jgi:ABC-type glycerol-3-phosphate transport system substrate-binding protein
MSDGVYGIPFAVDPLVMYWNRDIFSASNLATPPKTWETLVSQTTKAIVHSDNQFNISQSAVALGEYVNVTHAKDILAMLFIQAGTSIVREKGDSYEVTFDDTVENGLTPAEAALTFYTQFVSPGKDVYSWNRSKGFDRAEFLSGNLAMYFGKGSERAALIRENSNLNFDVAPIPQGEGSTVKRTYGDFYAFAIPRGSGNIQGAYAAATFLAAPANVKPLIDALEFAPVHRALFDGSETDPFKKVVNQSALLARGWLDPAPRETGDIFKTMIEEITSGRGRLKTIVTDAVQELAALFR